MVEHKETTLSLRGGKFEIQVVEGGSGPDLLYLHGEHGFSGWAPFIDALAENFHVYAPAHPGVADSIGLEELDDLWDLVLFYEELITGLGIEGAGVVGHSYGGMVAAELAAHRKDLVSRLALVGSLGLWRDEAPTLDFFTLTPSEEAKANCFDPESEAAKSAFAVPSDPEAKKEAMIERAKTLSSHRQVHLAHPRPRAAEESAPYRRADAAGMGRLGQDSATGIRECVSGPDNRFRAAGDRELWPPAPIRAARGIRVGSVGIHDSIRTKGEIAWLRTG